VFAVLLVATAGSTSFYFPPLTDVLATLWRELLHGGLVGGPVVQPAQHPARPRLATVVGTGAGLVIGEVRTLRLATARCSTSPAPPRPSASYP